MGLLTALAAVEATSLPSANSVTKAKRNALQVLLEVVEDVEPDAALSILSVITTRHRAGSDAHRCVARTATAAADSRGRRDGRDGHGERGNGEDGLGEHGWQDFSRWRPEGLEVVEVRQLGNTLSRVLA